jgi:hypothetical protein
MDFSRCYGNSNAHSKLGPRFPKSDAVSNFLGHLFGKTHIWEGIGIVIWESFGTSNYFHFLWDTVWECFGK